MIALLALPAPASAQRPAVLATGDSMMHVTQKELAWELQQHGADVTLRAHIGTGITKPDLLDWRKAARDQVAQLAPAATIVFLGAGDVYPLKVGRREYAWGTKGWLGAYERRVGAMLRSYLRTGRVYWLTLPTPRDRDLARVFRLNDRAVARAVKRAGPRARVVDITPLVTVDGRFRRKLVIDGKRQAVRQLDGVHLAPAGARVASRLVRAALQADGVLPR